GVTNLRMPAKAFGDTYWMELAPGHAVRLHGLLRRATAEDVTITSSYDGRSYRLILGSTIINWTDYKIILLSPVERGVSSVVHLYDDDVTYLCIQLTDANGVGWRCAPGTLGLGLLFYRRPGNKVASVTEGGLLTGRPAYLLQLEPNGRRYPYHFAFSPYHL